MTIDIRGVYPFNDDDPLANPDVANDLVDVRNSALSDGVDFAEFTQEMDAHPDFWQVAYDEECFDPAADIWTFFFHFIDFSKPLLAPDGPKLLPAPAPLPERFKDRMYFPP